MLGILTCNFENGKYLASIMDKSTITCDEVIESFNEDADAEAKSYDKAKSNDKVKLYDKTKTFPVNFNEKKAVCKTKNFYILLAFLLITVALLIAVSIYCYLIRYRVKRIHLLPFHDTNNGLRETVY